MEAAAVKTLYFLKRITPMGDNKHSIIPFKHNEIVIGRHNDCTYAIADLIISRKHAVFRRKEDGSWTVTSMGSNGLLVDGRKVQQHVEKRLELGKTVQFCIQPTKFVYKFVSKVVTSRRRNVDPLPSPAASLPRLASRHSHGTNDSCDQNLNMDVDTEEIDEMCATTKTPSCSAGLPVPLDATNSTKEITCTHGTLREIGETACNNTRVLFQEQNALELQLKKHQEKFKKLLTEKEVLTESSKLQMEQLEQRYKEERLELQRQVSEEQEEKRALQESEEKLALQLQEQEQVQKERRKLEEQLEQEKGEMQQQVQEAENKLQEQLQQRLQEQQKAATKLTEQLKEKSEAAQKLEALEGDKVTLEAQLDEARQKAEQVSQLHESIQKMEQEKELLQQEMEMMEFVVTAEAKKSVVDTVEQVMDSEMQCPVCSELFIKSVLLNCGHTFCRYCIDCWKKNKKDCPSCRSSITSETRNLAIDNFIDKIVDSLSDELKRKRQQMIKDRECEITARSAAAQAAKEAREAARANRGRGRRNARNNRRGGASISRGGANSNSGGASSTRGGATSARGGANSTTGGANSNRGGANSNRGGASTSRVEANLQHGATSTSTTTASSARSSTDGRVLTVVPQTIDLIPITILSDESSDQDTDDSHHTHLDSDSSLEGVEGVFFGGYGHCYNCGRRGHWSNGCPYI